MFLTSQLLNSQHSARTFVKFVKFVQFLKVVRKRGSYFKPGRFRLEENVQNSWNVLTGPSHAGYSSTLIFFRCNSYIPAPSFKSMTAHPPVFIFPRLAKKKRCLRGNHAHSTFPTNQFLDNTQERASLFRL